MPLKLIFYNRKGNKLKTLTNKKIGEFDGIYIVTEAIIQNHIKQSSTVLEISNITLNDKISDNILGIKSLR